MSKPETYATYRSENAPEGQQWLAYIHTGAGRLNMAFFATDEAGAVAKAKAFWDQDRAEREANIASREAARLKTAEARTRKSEAKTASPENSEA